jgi:hypothetical protein
VPDPRVTYIEMATGLPRREWCDRCLTSAVLAVDLYVLSRAGVGPPVGTVRLCTRCDPDPAGSTTT